MLSRTQVVRFLTCRLISNIPWSVEEVAEKWGRVVTSFACPRLPLPGGGVATRSSDADFLPTEQDAANLLSPPLVHRRPGMHRTALLLLSALVAAPVGAQQLEIHHIDVDQGDATLVVTPNGSTLLIDSGLDSRGDEVSTFLQSQGIIQIDAFLCTHYDSDHYGGIDKVVAAGITVDSWFERGSDSIFRPARRARTSSLSTTAWP